MFWDCSGSGLFCYVLHLALKYPKAPLQVSSLYWVALRKISEKEPLNCASATCSASFQRDSRDRQAQPAEDSRAREVADSGFTVPVMKIMEAKTWFRTIPWFLDAHQYSKAEMDCKGLCQAFPAAFCIVSRTMHQVNQQGDDPASREAQLHQARRAITNSGPR